MENPLLNNNAQPSGTCEYLKERLWFISYCFLAFCFVAGAILLGVGNNVEVCDFDSEFNCYEQSCRQDYRDYPCFCTDQQGIEFCGVKGPILGLIIAGAVLMGFPFLIYVGIRLYHYMKK